MSQNTIDTISEFLLQAGTEYRVFDLNRGIDAIDSQTFMNYETNSQAIASPRNGHAWFGIVFWNKQLNQEHYIWFIKLPIDENSLLIGAARNQFLEIVVNALGRELEHAQERQAELPENPFVFKPSQQLMADFNAVSKLALGLAFDKKWSAVQNYIKAPSVQDWRDLSIQAISDFAVTIEKSDEQQVTLANKLPLLAPAFLVSICTSFENIRLNSTLVGAIIDFYHQTKDEQLKSMLLRALSKQSQTEVVELIDSVIQNKHSSVSELIVIAGRFWLYLSDIERLKQFLQASIDKDESLTLFKGLYADLVQIKILRSLLLNLLRQKDISDSMARAFAALFTEYSKKPQAQS